MNDAREQKLIELGSETLARVLLELASQDKFVNDQIERLLSTPEQCVQRFEQKLESLRRSTRFIESWEISDFSRELQSMLQDLWDGASNPCTGVELVAAFFEIDGNILDRCDHSYDDVQDVFCFYAQDLFVDFASRCTDKKKVARLFLELQRNDNYGVRMNLVDDVSEFLPEQIIRDLISEMQKQADDDENENRSDPRLIESLAKQIKDF